MTEKEHVFNISDFGSFIKWYRKYLNLTEKELGRKIGLSRNSYYYLENLAKPPNPKKVEKVLTDLGFEDIVISVSCIEKAKITDENFKKE